MANYPNYYNQYPYQMPQQMQPMPQMQPMQVQQQIPQQPQQAQNGMIWVAGINEAMSYPVCPNAAVNLWDSTAPCVYVKSADATGKPSMKVYDLVERNQATQVQQAAQIANPVTREEFDALVAKVNNLTPKTKKKEEPVNE